MLRSFYLGLKYMLYDLSSRCSPYVRSIACKRLVVALIFISGILRATTLKLIGRFW